MQAKSSIFNTLSSIAAFINITYIHITHTARVIHYYLNNFVHLSFVSCLEVICLWRWHVLDKQRFPRWFSSTSTLCTKNEIDGTTEKRQEHHEMFDFSLKINGRNFMRRHILMENSCHYFCAPVNHFSDDTKKASNENNCCIIDSTINAKLMLSIHIHHHILMGEIFDNNNIYNTLKLVKTHITNIGMVVFETIIIICH